MASELPKQYLPLAGRPVLAHTLERLAALPLAGMVVVLKPEDVWFEPLVLGGGLSLPMPLLRTPGGAERAASVWCGLAALAAQAQPHDWVLVHDAARPLIRERELRRLVQALDGHPLGGLLAIPVRDTLKRADAHDAVVGTVERARAWQAQTPQMFRYGPLCEGLRLALEQGAAITDESSALERFDHQDGHRPLLVEGRWDNLKITHPDDLAIAEALLRGQRAESGQALDYQGSGWPS